MLDWTPNTNHTGVYVALDKGSFADAGLDVEILQPPEEGALPLVASGKAQFCVTFQENIAEAITSTTPMDVKAVAAILQHNTSGIISLKEDGINSPKDMENKVYATWDTPVEKAILKQVITKDGGDFEKVEMVPATVTDVVSALQANVDAVWILLRLEASRQNWRILTRTISWLKDIDPVLDFYTPVIASSNAYLNELTRTPPKAFLAACDKGYEYAIKNPATPPGC